MSPEIRYTNLNVMTKKQFEGSTRAQRCTVVIDHIGMFVPEMSMDIRDILSQFAYVDNIRLVDLADKGYFAADDDSAFDYPDFDSLDIAEKQDLFEKSQDFINRYQAEQKAKSVNSEPETPPADE